VSWKTAPQAVPSAIRSVRAAAQELSRFVEEVYEDN
jgi:hypothetical protein